MRFMNEPKMTRSPSVSTTKGEIKAKTKSKAFTLGKASVYLYVIVMAALFVNQASISLNKFLKEEIVEDVSVENRLTAMVPAITFCLLPGYKKLLSLSDGFIFDNYCPANTTDFKQCIDDLRFNVTELAMATFKYPRVFATPPNLTADWHPSSFNLYMGSCFTYQRLVEEEQSQIMAEAVILNQNDNELTRGWTLLVYIHNSGMFLPSVGISGDYAGQQYLGINPKVHGVDIINVDPTTRIHLNTESEPCQEDPQYNPVQCMEQYVYTTVGCASPWDIFPHPQGVCECESYDEFTALFNTHLDLYMIGAPQFVARTGCLPPCQYDDYDVELSAVQSDTFSNILKNTKGTGILISLRNTNKKIVREALLYEFNNLVGEIGGCLGMFLGVSLISLYQMILNFCQKFTNYV